MKSIKHVCWLVLLLPASASAWQWMDLWQTPDQQGSRYLQDGKPQAAAQAFKDKNWQSVAQYRSGNYEQAYTQFNGKQTSDGQFNAGNAAAFMGKYQEAIAAYDKAVALNAANSDAVFNRDIVKKLLQQQQQQPQDQKQNDQQQQNQKNQSQKNNGDNNKDKNKQNNSADNQNNPGKDSEKNQQNNQQSSKQNGKNSQDPDRQPKDSPPSQYNKMNKNEQAAATAAEQRQNENNQQVFRRLADEPGGLLQQKFLRDYYRRHGGEEDSEQGGMNAF